MEGVGCRVQDVGFRKSNGLGFGIDGLWGLGSRVGLGCRM